MITRGIFETIEALNQTYFEKWGCAVDYSIVPGERWVECLGL